MSNLIMKSILLRKKTIESSEIKSLLKQLTNLPRIQKEICIYARMDIFNLFFMHIAKILDKETKDTSQDEEDSMDTAANLIITSDLLSQGLPEHLYFMLDKEQLEQMAKLAGSSDDTQL